MKHKYLEKLGQYFFYFLLAVSVVLTVIFYLNTAGVNTNDPAAKQIAEIGPVLNIFFYWAYIMAAIAIVLAIGLPLINMASEPKKILKLLVAIVAVGVLVFIAYQFADGTPMDIAGYNGPDNIPSRLKMTDTAMFSMYGMIVVAALSLVYAEVSKLFK